MTQPMTPREKVLAAIKEADDTFGYSSEMIRLVDGVSTRRLKISGCEAIEITDSEENDWDGQSACYAIIADYRAAHRTDAILAALASGSGDHAELARLAEAASSGPWSVDADDDGQTVVASPVEIIARDTRHNSGFIAAANPATVLSLIAENAALRAERDRIAEELHGEINYTAEQSVRATEAERKLAEARTIIEEGLYARTDKFEAMARTFLSSTEAERG